METMSIKALALKALQGYRQGNQMETDSFPGKKPEGQVSGGGNSPAQMEDAGQTFMVYIYSHLLRDMLTLVRTDDQADALRRQGIEDVIYTGAEVQALKGKTPDEIRAVHSAKKAFPAGCVMKNGEKADALMAEAELKRAS